MAAFYAVLAILVFAVLGATYKLSSRLNCEPSHVNFFMFLSAAVLSLVWGLYRGEMLFVWTAVAIGVGMGVMCNYSVTVFRGACALGRMSTSWTVLNLALVVPVAASILIWGEVPKANHVVGLALTVAAIILIGIDIGRAGE